MKVLFFGTSDFAVPSLIGLHESRHEIIGVVTQPDKPTGRGLTMSMSPVKKVALDLGLEVYQPKRVRAAEFVDFVRELNPDSCALAAFGQIIPQSILDIPKFGPINLHGSLLPVYRGAAPIQYSILNGEQCTGNTTMWMDATLDTGDILLQQKIEIDAEETSAELIPKMAERGVSLLLETLDLLEAGKCPRTPQNNDLATYAPPITAEDTMVDWSSSAFGITNQVRAFYPKPGTHTLFSSRRIKLLKVGSIPEMPASTTPGTIVELPKNGIVVGTGNGNLMIHELQQEGSRKMNAADWARGVRVKIGDKFD